MQLRLFAHALVIAGAANLVACGGTTGTVEDTGGDPSAPSDSATTSGTGDDAVSSAGMTISGTGEDMESGVFRGHPLDDPHGELAARTIYFEFDSSEVMETERAAIEAHARYLSKHSGAQLTLEGHADERGSREYNIALGEQRAEAVRRLMTFARRRQPADPHHQLRRGASRIGRTRRIRVAAQPPGRSRLPGPRMIWRQTTAGLALAACILYASGVLAQAPVNDFSHLDERLARIERLLDSDSLIKLFDDVESQNIEGPGAAGSVRGAVPRDQSAPATPARALSRYRFSGFRSSRPPGPTQATVPVPAPATAPQAPVASTPTGSETAAVQPAPVPAAAPATQPGPSTGVDPFAEQQAYQAAFELLKAGRYEEAAEAFQVFIAAYPSGSYADNAQYWLGETHYITRKFELSVQEFQRLITTYPNSGKLTHALLKIGYAHDELGNKVEAERALSELVTRHPQSAAAGLARRRLQNIRQ